MDLWERGIHAGLLGDDEVEGESREVRTVIGGEDEYEAVSQSYHNMVLSGKLRQDVR